MAWARYLLAQIARGENCMPAVRSQEVADSSQPSPFCTVRAGVSSGQDRRGAVEGSSQLTRKGEASAMVFQRLMASRILPKAGRATRRQRSTEKEKAWVQAMQPARATRFTSRASRRRTLSLRLPCSKRPVRSGGAELSEGVHAPELLDLRPSLRPQSLEGLH